MACFFVPGSDDFLKIILSFISLTPHSWRAIRLSALLATFFVKELYLFANEGENHTNNVKQLEEMKKGTEDTRADSLTTRKLTCGKLTSNQPSNQ